MRPDTPWIAFGFPRKGYAENGHQAAQITGAPRSKHEAWLRSPKSVVTEVGGHSALPGDMQLRFKRQLEPITLQSLRPGDRSVQQLDIVHHWQWVPLFVQQSTELQLAPGVSGRYHLRGCGYDLLNLALAQFMGGLRLAPDCKYRPNRGRAPPQALPEVPNPGWCAAQRAVLTW